MQDEQKPVIRKLSESTKKAIHDVVDCHIDEQPYPANAELVYGYVVSLLENQWPCFWQEYEEAQAKNEQEREED